MHSFSDLFLDKIKELKQSHTPFVIVTLSSIKGSAPQNLGAKIIITLSDIAFGTIGGGKIESHCINVARDLLNSSDNDYAKSYKWNLQKDIGMTCGGEVAMLFEISKPLAKWNIVIFGAGHVSQALTRILLTLDCKLTVIDNRQEWLNLLPNDDKLTTILNPLMEEEVKSLAENSYVALMTMGHAKDVPILAQALKNRKFPFIGVIGSKSKKNAIHTELKSLGVSPDQLQSLKCPIGLDIGSNSPSEIAISITAQLLQLRGK